MRLKDHHHPALLILFLNCLKLTNAMTTTNKSIKFINIKSNAHGTIKHHSKTLVKIGLKDVLSSQKEKNIRILVVM